MQKKLLDIGIVDDGVDDHIKSKQSQKYYFACLIQPFT